MLVGPAALGPAEFSVGFGNGQIIDAGNAEPHQSLIVEFPVFIAVSAEPGAAIVVPFVRETDGDAVLVERPEFLDQPVAEFALPFAAEERNDFVPAAQELRAIPPNTIFG